MTLRSMLASSAARLSFAHLRTGPAAAKADETEDEMDARHAQEAEDRVAAEKDGKECESEDEMKARQDDEKAARAEDDDEGGNKGKKAKKAKRAKAKPDEGNDDDDEDEDDEDPDDEEPDGADAKAAYRAGRKAERARIGGILASEAAANNLELAAKLACTTGMASAAAIVILESQAAAPRGVYGRMAKSAAGAVRVAPSTERPSGPKAEQAAISSSWDKAFAAVRPAK